MTDFQFWMIWSAIIGVQLVIAVTTLMEMNR